MDKQNINKLYFDDDADISIVQNRKVAVIGYGNQGRAQALNLRDSNISVVIGSREGKSKQNALNDGFDVLTIENAVKISDIIVILLPDQIMSNIYIESIEPFLAQNMVIQFSHGYNIFYENIKLPKWVDITMVAPSGPGKLVREEFVKGSGVPNLIAVHQDFSGNAFELALSYSKAIGGTKIAAFKSTFKEETETDLFGEQAVLTGGIPRLIKESFKVLVESGYNPIVAWFVTYYEVKLIVDLFNEKGFQFMNDAISDTAEYGGQTRGSRLIDDLAIDKLKTFISEIQSGQFYNEWENESKAGLPYLNKIRDKEASSDFEQVTKFLLNVIHKNRTDS